jgi:transposase
MSAGDGRSLSPEALEVLRRRAVAAVESGVSRTEVARLFGVSRKTVGVWVAAYQQKGEDAFQSKRRGRRPGEQLALSPAQQAWTVRAIVDGTPDRLGMPHRLWTSHAIAELINREFRIQLSPATVSNYLVRWGLVVDRRLLETMRGKAGPIVPRPRTRRAEGNEWLENAETLWLAWMRPHTPAEVKREPSLIGRNLLSGFRDYYGDVNVLLAMSSRGMVFFKARRGPFDAQEATDFLERLMAQVGRGLNLVICSWPLEHYGIVRTWPEQHGDKLSIRFSIG